MSVRDEPSQLSWSHSPGKISSLSAWGAASSWEAQWEGMCSWAEPVLVCLRTRESHILPLSLLLPWLEVTTSILPECQERARVPLILKAAISVWVSSHYQKGFASMLILSLITHASVLLAVS